MESKQLTHWILRTSAQEDKPRAISNTRRTGRITAHAPRSLQYSKEGARTHERTFQTLKWAMFLIWIGLIAGLLLTGCASRAVLLRDHTVQMAKVMGVEPTPGIIFGKLPRYAWGLGKTCGYTTTAKHFEGLWIAYDDRSWECRLMSVHHLVLHELCHVKYAHPYAPRRTKEMEREAEECVRLYWNAEDKGRS